jgi:hypothetical protein
LTPKASLGEYADMKSMTLVRSERNPLERAAIYNSGQGVIFRREEFTPDTFNNASTNHKPGFETRWVVAVAK